MIVQAALDMVKRAMSRANDYIAIDSIKNCPINLSKEAGSFVMREKFLVLRPNKIGQTFESTVFFFDEIIVFTIDCYVRFLLILFLNFITISLVERQRNV